MFPSSAMYAQAVSLEVEQTNPYSRVMSPSMSSGMTQICQVCMQAVSQAVRCDSCSQGVHVSCSIQSQGWNLCLHCYREMERVHQGQMDQNRAQERMGIMNYSQDTARAAAHHAAMAGSVIGSLSAGAVGAAFGFGRNLFASGRQTVQTQMPMMQPNRSLPPIPQSFGPPTSVTAPVESSTVPVPGIYRELAQLRAENLRMRAQQSSIAGDQSYRDAQSVVGGEMEFNGGLEEATVQGPSSSGAYLAGMQGPQEPNGTHTQVQANGLDVGEPTGGDSATGLPVGAATASVETKQNNTARTQGLAQPSREGPEWMQFWTSRVRGLALIHS